MYKIKIITINKIKEKWLQNALEKYEKLISINATISWEIVKDNLTLIKKVYKEKKFFALDENGLEFSSIDFSSFLLKELEKNHTKITFVIGGSEGLPKEILNKAIQKISFSKMTFTHQMIRLFMLEQIYRAFEINRNSSYHK